MLLQYNPCIARTVTLISLKLNKFKNDDSQNDGFYSVLNCHF